MSRRRSQPVGRGIGDRRAPRSFIPGREVRPRAGVEGPGGSSVEPAAAVGRTERGDGSTVMSASLLLRISGDDRGSCLRRSTRARDLSPRADGRSSPGGVECCGAQALAPVRGRTSRCPQTSVRLIPVACLGITRDCRRLRISIEHMVEITESDRRPGCVRRRLPWSTLRCGSPLRRRRWERIDRIGFLDRAKASWRRRRSSWKRSTSRPRNFRCRSRRVCRRGGGGWGSRTRSVSRPRCRRRRRRGGWRTRGCWSTEMPATLRALAAGRVCERGVRAAITETRCLTREDRGRVDSELGLVVGSMSVPGDQPGGAAAGDRTRPGRRRPPGSAGPGGPVRVHPTPAGHHGHDHRSPAGGTSRGVFRVATRRCGISQSDRGRTHQSPDQGRHPHRTDHRPDHRGCRPGGGPAGDDQRRPPGTLRGTRPTPRPRTTPRVPGPPHHHPRPPSHPARVWVRRLLTDPIDDTVATIDTRRRRFDGALAVLINARDQVCRDPYCSAPIRDLDHLHDHADGGPTSRQRHRTLPTRQPRRPDPRLAHHRHRQTPGGDHAHRRIATTPGHHQPSDPDYPEPANPANNSPEPADDGDPWKPQARSSSRRAAGR